MKILAISGSTRRDSFNTRLARLVAEVRPADEVVLETDLVRVPFYDADLDAAGATAVVAALRDDVQAADVVVMVTPEYNHSVPGVLANAVDWLSRPYAQSVLLGKPVVVLSASISPYGGARAAEHLRQVLTVIGAVVSTEELSLGNAHEVLSGPAAGPELVAELTAVLDRALSALAEPVNA